VPEIFLESIDSPEEVVEKITEMDMRNWGADPLKRVSFVARKLYGAKGPTPADTIDSISAPKENVRI
jgi:hypothetical protein